MKTIKQRFHKEIVKKFKENYFATIRKEILQVQEFQSFYNKTLDNNQDLITLVDKLGYVVFYKHINQILDNKLYAKLYQNEKYFLNNLNFVIYLLESQVLPIQQIYVLISGLGEIVRKYHSNIAVHTIKEIFEIVHKVIETKKYIDASFQVIKNESLILGLYEIVLAREMKEYFFQIVHFCKVIGDYSITKISDKQQLHCLQIHILTSDCVEELYASYSIIGDIFQKTYTPEEQLFEYGSILDKTIKDISIDRLVDPISYFFLKALNNHSLKKLIVEMNSVEVIFNVIVNNLLRKNNISVFGHQSIWNILKKIIQTILKANKSSPIDHLDWQSLVQKLKNHPSIKYPYIKIQIYQVFRLMEKTRQGHLFADFVLSQCGQLKKQLGEVQL